MKLRVTFWTCLVLALAFVLFFAVASWANDDDPKDQDYPEPEDEPGGEDGDEEDEDEWGDAKIDHQLNVGWEYPAEHVQRPLVYPRHVTEFGMIFDYKFARHYYNDDGELIEGSFQTKKETLNLFLGMGFTDKWSMRINFPFVWKKTKITSTQNQNYRAGRDNVYGYLAEEAVVDYFDHHELWKLWEADLPQLGDVDIWMGWSPFRPKTLEEDADYMTSWIWEVDYKAPTGNDNPRRGNEVRNFLTDGTPDTYFGTAVKQMLWRFSLEGHLGYNWRMPASVKYLAGEIDFADQIKADGEVAFQLPEAAVRIMTANLFKDSGAIILGGHYMTRVTDTEIKDKNGNTITVDDAPGYLASFEPQLILHGYTGFFKWFSGDVVLSADVPMAGQNSFFVASRSSALPPFEVESYEGVGITYSLGLIKRWQ